METNYKYKSLSDFREVHPNLYRQLINRNEWAKLCEDMGWVYGPIKYASEEEHKDFIIQTNSNSGPKYFKVYKTSNLNLHSQPWDLFGFPNQKEYFESIFEYRGIKGIIYASEEEHREFIINNKADSEYKYLKIYKTSELKLHSQPQKLFGHDTLKEYFDSIFGDREIIYASEEEHREFIINNKADITGKYRKIYKTSELKLHSQPQKLFGYNNGKEYFDSIFRYRIYASKKEHIEFIINNKVDKVSKYRKIYKTSELKLHSTPWLLFGYTNFEIFLKSIFDNK